MQLRTSSSPADGEDGRSYPGQIVLEVRAENVPIFPMGSRGKQLPAEEGSVGEGGRNGSGNGTGGRV